MYSLIFIAHLFSAGVEVGQVKLEHLYVDQATCERQVSNFERIGNDLQQSYGDLKKFDVKQEFNLECNKSDKW